MFYLTQVTCWNSKLLLHEEPPVEEEQELFEGDGAAAVAVRLSPEPAEAADMETRAVARAALKGSRRSLKGPFVFLQRSLRLQGFLPRNLGFL